MFRIYIPGFQAVPAGVSDLIPQLLCYILGKYIFGKISLDKIICPKEKKKKICDS